MGEGERPGQSLKVAGTPFGNYTLLCRLATGGMGEIFVAQRTAAGGFEKLVVIKRLLPHLAEDAHFVAMLLDEARVAARLSHPNVCQVYDLGEVDGHYYIAMEHLEGVPASLILRRANRAGQRLELGLATAILRQAADGLHHAHDLCDRDGNPVGLVHRDVSPSNLFATASGVVKVLDFGVAKSQDALARTHTGALKGKYAYMSPEHVVGDQVDRRSDVWSLGVVLYELITAQRLFWRESEYKMFQAIVEDPIPSLFDRWPGLPTPVARVVERALSRDAARRFASAAEMAEALEEAMASAGGIWRPARVADHVATHFGSLLEERRRDVQTALERGHGADEAVDILLGDELSRPTRPASREGSIGRTRLLLGALAMSVALAAGGLFAYRDWSAEPPPPPIVVLGGEVETTDGRVTRAPAPAPARPDLPVASQAPDGPVASRGAEGPVAPSVENQTAPSPRAPAGDPYSAVLARHQDRIRRCFSTATDVAGIPELAVSLDIDRRGAVTRAALTPADLEATQLGQCLLAILRRARFARQTDPVQVTIPLRVRKTQ
jgi:Protein kinase domain